MKKITTIGILLILLVTLPLWAQDTSKQENTTTVPLKVHHAEPLYVDLVRDLGARKGEAEWNLAFGTGSHHSYQKSEILVEYEFAPADRLGIEFEVPVAFQHAIVASENQRERKNGIEGVKTAIQYTFLVSEKAATSMAVGYIHEFSLFSFAEMRRQFLRGETHNPFLVAAKRWGKYLHTLLYTGPAIDHDFGEKWLSHWEHNLSVHFMLPTTGDFVGLEMHEEMVQERHQVTFRPQMRLAIHSQVKLGLVATIPMDCSEEGIGCFTRLIFEPGG